MDGVAVGLWRTLARIYTVVFACGVCVPATAAVPVLVGLDSLFVTLLFGVAGLGLAGGVTVLVDAQLDAMAAQRLRRESEPPRRPPAGETPGESARA